MKVAPSSVHGRHERTGELLMTVTPAVQYGEGSRPFAVLVADGSAADSATLANGDSMTFFGAHRVASAAISGAESAVKNGLWKRLCDVNATSSEADQASYRRRQEPNGDSLHMDGFLHAMRWRRELPCTEAQQ